MARMPPLEPLMSPADIKVVESVLGTNSAYVLNFFSDHTFNQFIKREVGINAYAPEYAVDGDSKAARLNRVLHSLKGDQQAKLLRALLTFIENPVRAGQVGKLDLTLRQSFLDVAKNLEAHAARQEDGYYSASAWTGRRTVGEQRQIVRDLAPIALQELDALAGLVESKRFNDQITADAVQNLRELHAMLGEILSTVDRGGVTRRAFERLEAKRQELVERLKEGAKVSVVAPSMTFGLMHLLAWMSNVAIDSTMVVGVFATVVGADVLKSNKQTERR